MYVTLDLVLGVRVHSMLGLVGFLCFPWKQSIESRFPLKWDTFPSAFSTSRITLEDFDDFPRQETCDFDLAGCFSLRSIVKIL